MQFSVGVLTFRTEEHIADRHRCLLFRDMGNLPKFVQSTSHLPASQARLQLKFASHELLVSRQVYLDLL